MTLHSNKNINFIFFGTSRFSVLVLEELRVQGYIPALIVTVPDKPKGRKLLLTPPETKIWAMEQSVPYVQLHTLKNTSDSLDSPQSIIESFSKNRYDVGIVASYGKIIPQNILDVPIHGMLNIHPSLLPKLRGASPLQGTILSNEGVAGVTIMHLDALMDHGNIILQEKVSIQDWPPYESDLEEILARKGGMLLGKNINGWIFGTLQEKEQDHAIATYTKKIEKTDGEINLEDLPEQNIRKIRAYHVWPGAYFFTEYNGKRIRVIVKKARIENDKLVLERVVPEGKKEMNYVDFINGEHLSPNNT